MVTFNKAVSVAAKVSELLGTPRWLRGVVVAPDPTDGFVVTVRVSKHGAKTLKLEKQIDGVKVRIEIRSEIPKAT